MINKAIEDLKRRANKLLNQYFEASSLDNDRRIYEQSYVLGSIREIKHTCSLLFSNDIISYEASKEISEYINNVVLETIYDDLKLIDRCEYNIISAIINKR